VAGGPTTSKLGKDSRENRERLAGGGANGMEERGKAAGRGRVCGVMEKLDGEPTPLNWRP
jgi:hypothetical protein